LDAIEMLVLERARIIFNYFKKIKKYELENFYHPLFPSVARADITVLVDWA